MMEGLRGRSSTGVGGRRFVPGILLVLLVCYSSMNWFGSIFHPAKREDGRRHYSRNATSSSAAVIAMRASVANRDHAKVADVDIGATANNATTQHSLRQGGDLHINADARSKSEVPPGVRAERAAATSTTIASTSIRGGINATYIPLPPSNASLLPVSFTGCCGIGHRLARNIPTMVYAVSHSRPVHANWNQDVKWSVLFNDTPNIKQLPAAGEKGEEYMDIPPGWKDSPLARIEKVGTQGRHTAYHRYGEDVQSLFEMPLAQSIIKSLSDNLSPLVLSFLEPMREQYADLHLCVHVREGNNETGDWERKKWRHIDMIPILNITLGSMRNFTKQNNAQKASVFVASDTVKARSWFEENAPSNWHVVKPAKEIPRPKSGVWFGELVSPTNSILSEDELNEAMAEAVADVFALGECDALYVPNFSSFSVVGITLARAERRKVFFYWWESFIEYPYQ